ncbi:MAG: GDP-mannose 4,6-dehydratase [bacterium]|nr:GDP-mannose 4,6-dehydratase [bacterium]
MNILVTGGLGFIGSEFVDYVLEETQDSVVSVDFVSYASRLRNIEHERYRFVKMDINDLEAEDLEGIDAIVSFAAETMVDQSIDSPAPFYRANILGAAHVMRLAAKKKIRILQISTDEVYGTLPPDIFAKEDANYNPSNPYAASKTCAEIIAKSYHNTYGLDVVMTRSTNNYGPRQNREKLIPTIIAKVLEGTEIPLYGDGKHRRDWLYVRDNVRAVYFALKNGVSGQAYNIAGGNERENKDMVDAVVGALNTVTGKTHAYRTKSIPDEIIRPGHDRRYGVDASKLHALGWKPQMSLEKGLEHTVRWYLENPKDFVFERRGLRI